MARVRLRVAMGGHDVPEKDIRRRWDLSHANLAWFARTVHEVRVYDDSNHGCRPALVARASGGRVAFCKAGNLPSVEAALAGLQAHLPPPAGHGMVPLLFPECLPCL